jgi:hypothetical protein
LRLETDAKCDKKKSELYFGCAVKKILTENSYGHRHLFKKITQRATLTESLPSRMIFPPTDPKLPLPSVNK